jgi:hypothetical protein
VHEYSKKDRLSPDFEMRSAQTNKCFTLDIGNSNSVYFQLVGTNDVNTILTTVVKPKDW